MTWKELNIDLEEILLSRINALEQRIGQLENQIAMERHLRHLLLARINGFRSECAQQSKDAFDEVLRYAVAQSALAENGLREHQIMITALMAQQFPDHSRFEDAITAHIGVPAFHAPPHLDRSTVKRGR